MATRKKNSSQAQTARGDEFAPAAPRLSRTRNTAAPEGAIAPERKKAKSSAATHKSPARKTGIAAAASEPAVEAVIVETATFDVGLHHEEISKEAYCTWLRNGCPQGSEHHDWLAAIEIVRARHQR